MPDLNEQVLPVVWTLVREALRADPMVRDELVERLTPTGLITRKGETTSRHVVPSIRALEEHGLIEADGEKRLRLTQPDLDDGGFRLAVARSFLHVSQDDDLWAGRGDVSLANHAQVAVAWLCLQGVDQAPPGWPAVDTPLTVQWGPATERQPLRDTAPYNTLERLVRWLGIAADVYTSRRTQSLLTPDPTELVRAALDELLPAGTAAPMNELLERTAGVFPWMPHGWIGRAVAERMNVVPDPSAEDGRCPQCLSLALLRLELDGVLTLETGDDPSRRTSLSLTGDARRGVTRVVRA